MIDRKRIEELKGEIGEDDMTAVLHLFLAEAERAIERIASGLSDDEHGKATHFLRSGALNIGLVGLAAEADKAAAVPENERAATAADLTQGLEDAIALLNLPTPVN